LETRGGAVAAAAAAGGAGAHIMKAVFGVMPMAMTMRAASFSFQMRLTTHSDLLSNTIGDHALFLGTRASHNDILDHV
jgi:hypothetical protein